MEHGILPKTNKTVRIKYGKLIQLRLFNDEALNKNKHGNMFNKLPTLQTRKG